MAPFCSFMRIEKLKTMEQKDIGLTKDRSSNNPISKEGFQNMCIHLYTFYKIRNTYIHQNFQCALMVYISNLNFQKRTLYLHIYISTFVNNVYRITPKVYEYE